MANVMADVSEAFRHPRERVRSMAHYEGVDMIKNTETKEFHIGDVLSAATGRLVSPRHIGGVYDILGWMVGEDLMTHSLPRVSRECEPALRAQFPDLCAVEIPDTINSKESAVAFLETLYPRFGETVAVAKLDEADHTTIDPIAEIKMIRPDLPVLGVDL